MIMKRAAATAAGRERERIEAGRSARRRAWVWLACPRRMRAIFSIGLRFSSAISCCRSASGRARRAASAGAPQRERGATSRSLAGRGVVFSPSASCFFFKRWARCFMFTVDGVWQSTVGLMLARRSRGSLCTYRSRCGTERAEERGICHARARTRARLSAFAARAHLPGDHILPADAVELAAATSAGPIAIEGRALGHGDAVPAATPPAAAWACGATASQPREST